jgi:hypothetical protein
MFDPFHVRKYVAVVNGGDEIDAHNVVSPAAFRAI